MTRPQRGIDRRGIHTSRRVTTDSAGSAFVQTVVSSATFRIAVGIRTIRGRYRRCPARRTVPGWPYRTSPTVVPVDGSGRIFLRAPARVAQRGLRNSFVFRSFVRRSRAVFGPHHGGFGGYPRNRYGVRRACRFEAMASRHLFGRDSSVWSVVIRHHRHGALCSRCRRFAGFCFLRFIRDYLRWISFDPAEIPRPTHANGRRGFRIRSRWHGGHRPARGTVEHAVFDPFRGC